jgi:outer membrane immunogenic protein
MNKLLFMRVAAVALAMAGPAVAADMPLQSLQPASFASRFTWTSCYFGGHLGGGWARKDMTDPVQLVQDSFGETTTGVTTVGASPSGVVVGLQIGCDYQFAPNWVVGIEGAAAGSTMKGHNTVGLPLGDLGDQAVVTATTDFLMSATARLGYAFDRVLIYGKGGVAYAGDHYTVAGTFIGTGFNFEGLDTRVGWTVGGGLEWAFSRSWSASIEYDYYSFGRGNILMSDGNNEFSGPVNVKQSVQIVKAGLNFHVWASDQ